MEKEKRHMVHLNGFLKFEILDYLMEKSSAIWIKKI